MGDPLFEFNIYPATKHGSVALTHVIRRELADIKAPIRVTVSYDHISSYFLLFYLLMLFYINDNI